MSNQVSIAQAARIITQLAPMNPKILLLGPPGVAKTSVVRQVADALGKKLVTVMLSQMAPEHVTGYPYIDNGTMRYALPDWFPRDENCVVFFDEITQCQVAMQNVAMQLIFEGRVGPHQLPAGTITIGAGNRAEDRAGSTVMTTTLRSRFDVVIEIEPEKQEWLDYAKQADFNPFIVAYVEAIRTSVVQFDPRQKGGFVTLRTLEQAGRALGSYDSDPENPDLRAILHGILGNEAASELVAFLRTYAALPHYDDIRLTPTEAPVEVAHLDAVAKMLAEQGRFSHGGAIATYINRYDDESATRLVFGLCNALQKHPSIIETRNRLGLDT